MKHLFEHSSAFMDLYELDRIGDFEAAHAKEDELYMQLAELVMADRIDEAKSLASVLTIYDKTHKDRVRVCA